ncbi:MAG: hypothetical protein ACI843_000496 [Psychrobacter glaciei]|jgi:hypothetical protein
MTKNTKHFALKRKTYLAMTLPLLMAAQAQSIEFKMGEATTTLDTQLSIGSSWRVEDADNTKVGVSNVDSTDDDGNRNYKKGDAFSQIFKGSHDLHIKYQNIGVFLRGKYWYDSAIENNSVDFGHGPTATVNAGFVPPAGLQTGVNYNANKKLDDSDFDDLSKGSGATLLDAFVYGQFDLGEIPLDVRLGQQVISWGESTFIIGGINTINPVDLSAFRRPGAEIKEGLLPVGMVYANVGLTYNLNAEVFYKYEYQNTIVDGCGTYFSTSDVAAQGCNTQVIAGGVYSLTKDQSGVKAPSDDGQYGFALRYYAEDIGAEFGLYAMNNHSTSPIYNVYADTANDFSSAGFGAPADSYIPFHAGDTDGGITNAITMGRIIGTSFALSYPEDNQLVGISFSTNVAGIAWSGEISHKIDSPVAINTSQVASAVLARGTTADTNKAAAYLEIYGSTSPSIPNPAGATSPIAGDLVKGYREFDITQVQTTLINTFNNIAGASQVAIIGEVGAQFIHNFDKVLRYGRAPFFGEPTLAANEDSDSFTTESSFGYRARASATYNNVFSGIDVTPTVSWAHDVSGTSAGPGGPFLEDNQALGFSVKAKYLERYSASLAYTMYEGGDYSLTGDRDFVSASLDVQF